MQSEIKVIFRLFRRPNGILRDGPSHGCWAKLVETRSLFSFKRSCFGIHCTIVGKSSFEISFMMTKVNECVLNTAHIGVKSSLDLTKLSRMAYGSLSVRKSFKSRQASPKNNATHNTYRLLTTISNKTSNLNNHIKWQLSSTAFTNFVIILRLKTFLKLIDNISICQSFHQYQINHSICNAAISGKKREISLVCDHS